MLIIPLVFVELEVETTNSTFYGSTLNPPFSYGVRNSKIHPYE